MRPYANETLDKLETDLRAEALKGTDKRLRGALLVGRDTIIGDLKIILRERKQNNII